MTTSFPTSVDSLTNPSSTAGNTLASVPHDGQHSNANDAIEAMEAIIVGPVFRNVKGYGAVGDNSNNDTTAIQNCINAVSADGGGIVYFPEGTYKITGQITGANNVSLQGAGRESTFIRYATTPAISMVKFTECGHLSVKGLGFRCDATVATKMLHFDGCVYVWVEECSFGGIATIGTGANLSKGILFEQTTYTGSGYVPPRGQVTFRNILAVVEQTDSGGAGSVGIHIKGHASQNIEYVSFDGEGNIEHFETGVKMENVSGWGMGPGWHLRGNSLYEIHGVNSDNGTVYGVGFAPTATTGTCVLWDANSFENSILFPRYNLSSGAPLALVTDNGARNNRLPGLGGTGTGNYVGRVEGPFYVDKTATAGGRAALEVRGSAIDTDSVFFVRTDVAATGTIAMMKLERGSWSGDMVRMDINGTNRVKIDTNGTVYHYCHTSAPADAALIAGQIAFYAVEGSSKISFKYRDSGGTVRTGDVGTYT